MRSRVNLTKEKTMTRTFLIAFWIAIFAGFAFGQAQTANREQMRSKGESNSATRDVVQDYFDRLKRKEEWKSFFADDIDFYQLTSPNKHTTGKSAYIEATNVSTRR